MKETEEPLGYLLLKVAKRYKSLFLEENVELDIDRYHYVLVLIDDHKEQLTQKGLAEILGVDKSYMVGIINYLAKKGYVLRETKLQDRRCQFVKLTEKAKVSLQGIRNSISAINEVSIGNISNTELNIFKKVLNQIQLNLSKGLPQIGGPLQKAETNNI